MARPIAACSFTRNERNEERDDSDQRTSGRARLVAKKRPVLLALAQPSRERAPAFLERASTPVPCPLRHSKPSTSSAKGRRLLEFLCWGP